MMLKFRISLHWISIKLQYMPVFKRSEVRSEKPNIVDPDRQDKKETLNFTIFVGGFKRCFHIGLWLIVIINCFNWQAEQVE